MPETMEARSAPTAKFWDWEDGSGVRTLRLEGPIDEEDIWGGSVTPKAFRDELYEDTGDITVWINSPGGSVFAAAEIYTMLRDYPGDVTVRIASLAASAASVVAMAGDLVQMSPTAVLMIHDPATIAMGNARDMERAIDTLNEVKEAIINAYMAKTGLSRNKISNMMENETWLNARKAVRLGFADGILFDDTGKNENDDDEDEDDGMTEQEEQDGTDEDGGADEGEKKRPSRDRHARDAAGMKEVIYSTRKMGLAILNRLCAMDHAPDMAQDPDPFQEGSGNSGGKPQEETPKENSGNSAGKSGAGSVNGGEAPATEDTTKDKKDNAADDKKDISEDDAAEDTADDTADGSAAGQEAVTATDAMENSALFIGMDGRTFDGAMPYELLRKQLDFLR